GSWSVLFRCWRRVGKLWPTPVSCRLESRRRRVHRRNRDGRTLSFYPVFYWVVDPSPAAAPVRERSRTGGARRDRELRPRGRGGRAEAEVLLVDRRADCRQRLALVLHAHHVTRDIQAHGSGRSVAREGQATARFRLHVARPVRGVAEVFAPARTRHPAQRVGLARREGGEPGGVPLGRDERLLSLLH